MRNKKIILAGGTGFIGRSLARFFGAGNEVIVLGRSVGVEKTSRMMFPDNLNIRFMAWDGSTAEAQWARELDGADLLINLAGRSVNCRYHKRQKEEILGSRVNSTRALGEAVRACDRPPGLWINAASATIYRHTMDQPNDELTGTISVWKKDNMPFNWIDSARDTGKQFVARFFDPADSSAIHDTKKDFSVAVCQAWEREFFAQETPATRKVALRIAITLGTGGAMIPLLNLCRFGLGGRQGTGRQMFSWVHEEDLARMMEWLFENERASGVYNCSAPEAVTNGYLMKALRKACGTRFGLPSPAWFLELGALIAQTETELILKSRWVSPARALSEGFRFRYSTIDDALRQVVESVPRKRYRLF